MILGVLKRLDEPLPGLRRKNKASSGFDISAGIGQRLGANVLTNGPVRQLCGLHQEDALILRGTDVDARSSPRCLGYTHTTIVHTLSGQSVEIGVRMAIVTQLSVDVPIKGSWALQGNEIQAAVRFHT